MIELKRRSARGYSTSKAISRYEQKAEVTIRMITTFSL